MKQILSIFLAIYTLGAFAQSTSTSPDGKSATIAIQSSSICDMCEKTIEENMIYEKGVKKVDVDLTTATVQVTYDPRKNDAAKLRAALTKLGYSADGTAADPAAFAKLPMCCQKEGCGKLPVKP